jgi:membrane protein YdbS with pleckstrin-like domain
MAGSHDPDRYLLPSERRVIRLRRHWTIVAWDAIETVLLLCVLAGLSDIASSSAWLVQNILWYLALLVLLRFGYTLYEWWDERFLVTDKRFVLITGVLATRVAMMPLSKVTDLTYERNVLGRMLGYGTIVVESAGQIQAFSRIEHLPQPERIYDAISELVFGDKQSQSERFSMIRAQRMAKAQRVAR